jgi:peptide/nickel transport system substrate-binding protein
VARVLVSTLAGALTWAALLCATVAARAATPDARTLRVAVYALPPGLGNPYTGTGMPSVLTWPAIFETLTLMGADGRLQPMLATAWGRRDPTTWRFELRRGVTFSDGEPFDAAAVAHALDYLATPEGKATPVGRDLAVIAAHRVLDDHAIEIVTREPVPLLPELVSSLRVVAPAQWRRLGPAGFAAAPVGTGPYLLERWQGAQVRLVRNPHAWRRPQLDRIEIVELPDAASRVQGIQSGRIDVAVQLGPDDEEPLRAAGAQLLARPAGGVLTLQFITERAGSPLRDVRVRQALNLATDREKIARVLFRGRTVAASQPAARQAFGYDPSLAPWPYDPAAARRLLAEAGHADGLALTAEVVIGAGANDALAYQSVAADLRLVGVTLTLRTIPTSVLMRNVFAGGWRGDAFGMDYGSLPTLDALRPFRLHSCLWPKPWYCDPEIVPLIKAARVELDEGRRLELTREVVRRSRDRASALFLYEIMSFDALAPRVRDYRNTFGVIDYAALDVVP